MDTDGYNSRNVAINMALFQRLRFYHMCHPNTKRIFGYNIYWLSCVTICLFVQTLVIFGTTGLFVKMEDALLQLDSIDIFTHILVIINFYICLWKTTVILYKTDEIWDVIKVSQINFFTSEYCTRNINILLECRNRTIKLTNFYSILVICVGFQWAIYPAMVMLFKNHNADYRKRNIFDLQYPYITLHAYNQYFFVFYAIEFLIIVYLMYTTIMVDTFLMSFCWNIMAQYKILYRAFEDIGNEDTSRIGKDNKPGYVNS